MAEGVERDIESFGCMDVKQWRRKSMPMDRRAEQGSHAGWSLKQHVNV